jgi:hypothetical protein
MSDLYAVLRARAHNQLTAHTATLAEANRLAQDWQARREGPAVVVREAAVLAAHAKARAAVARADPAAAGPGFAGLLSQAEHEALLRLLYSHLPFIACQPGGVPGVCYLLHFDRPYRHARNYIGWAETGRLEARLGEHRAGSGARLLAVVAAAGTDWTVARIWKDTDRYFERLLKVRRRATRLCPVCSPGNRRGIPATS